MTPGIRQVSKRYWAGIGYWVNGTSSLGRCEENDCPLQAALKRAKRGGHCNKARHPTRLSGALSTWETTTGVCCSFERDRAVLLVRYPRGTRPSVRGCFRKHPAAAGCAACSSVLLKDVEPQRCAA